MKCLYIVTDKQKLSISGSEEALEWEIRYKVAAGIAEGLLYLHCECQKRIIHRDITASNILLTEDYEPQVSIFFHLFPNLLYEAKPLLICVDTDF